MTALIAVQHQLLMRVQGTSGTFFAVHVGTAAGGGQRHSRMLLEHLEK